MARVYEAINKNRLEVEAYIEAEASTRQSKEAKKAKKRPWLLTIYLLLIVASVVAAAYFVFFSEVRGSMITAVQTALERWADQLSFSYDDMESADYSGGFGERLLSGILGFFGIIFQTIGSTLLRLVALISPLIIVAVVIAAVYWIVRLCLGGIECIGWRAATPEEIRERVIDRMDGKMRGLLSGVEGEQQALDFVSKLDNTCHVFSNLVVWLDDACNETDLIVVNTTGITIVEVKNYSGTLLGDWSEPEIIQRKRKKKNKYSDNERDNPVYQSQEPAKKLEGFLERRGISVNVRRCVLFTNKNVDIQVTDRQGLIKDCPLFTLGSTNLLLYLHSDDQQSLDHAQIQKIVSSLCTFL